MQEGIVVILGSSKCLPIGRNWKRALSCGSLEDPGMDDSVQGSLLCPASREAPRRFESFKDVAPRTVGRLLFVGPTGHTGLDGLFVQTAGKPPEATSNRERQPRVGDRAGRLEHPGEITNPWSIDRRIYPYLDPSCSAGSRWIHQFCMAETLFKAIRLVSHHGLSP